ncbi:MAG: hypothetical protein RMJ82_15700 [Gemmatales bacterium]|nr:hypothetical protein [Gemmatales bacterium]
MGISVVVGEVGALAVHGDGVSRVEDQLLGRGQRRQPGHGALSLRCYDHVALFALVGVLKHAADRLTGSR